MPAKHTKESFISRSVSVHGDKYDYSLVEYVSGRKAVKIICHKHGLFEQRPDNHLIGKSCRYCSLEDRRLGLKSFIDKSVAIHGNRYDYSLVSYKNNRTKVRIICKTHGEFEQTPRSHLSGFNCYKCAKISAGLSNRVCVDDFILSARKVHGFRYDYSLISEINKTISKVKIICEHHGVFTQTASKHLIGSGCPSCAKTGFDPSKAATLYVLRSECGSFIKVGISKDTKTRFRTLKAKTPFEFSPIEQLHGDGLFVADAEKKLHAIGESANLVGFDGCTEWFKYDREIINMAVKMFKQPSQSGNITRIVKL